MNNRTRATEATAATCHKTALLLAEQMPPKPDRIVIPAGGQWFVMDDEFDWIVESPDRKVGITHGIKLNARPFPGYYTLAPVPADSLFARYLNTSLPDLAVRELVQEYIGYTLCNMNLQCAQLWVGNGSNGKALQERLATDQESLDLIHPLLNLHELDFMKSASAREDGARETGEVFTALNRHQVMHGESWNYGTELNSLKAFSFLAFVGTHLPAVLEHERSNIDDA